MTNSSKQFTSINSFVCHTANSKNLQFPQKQLNLYCQSNECAFEKVINIFNSYYDKFKWDYENFNELILILSIAVKKIDLKAVSFNQKVKEEAETVLKKALLFLEDLITSKMLLVCLASKKKQNLITQHFLYTKGFLSLLVPQLLALELYTSIIDLLQKCNKNSKSPKLVSLNFLVQYMFVSTVIENLSQQSEDNFRFVVLDLLQEKKQLIFHLLWSVQNNKENLLEFKEIFYLRLDVQSPKIYGLKITNEDKLIPCQNATFSPEDWISEAYKKRPNPSIWRNINLKTVLDIYQFLFKLEVFASSPQIEDLDYLIPNNDDFLQVFSKFLMGQKLVSVKRKKNQNSRDQQEDEASIIKHLEEIKKVFTKVDKPYKHILRNQISKFFDESSESSDKEKQK